MNYDPPYILSNIFNDSYYTDLDGNLSLAAADLRYLKLSGGIVYGLTTFSNSLNVIGTLSINGSAVDLTLISGVIAGTPQNSKVLSLDSSGNINGGFNISSLVIGTSYTGPNLLRFYGTTGDASNNMTVIAERIYSGTECSELILFKGNDPAGSAGPDRLRFRASEHRFQTYTATEDWSTLADNNDRFVILNNGNCGIGVSSPSYQLELASGGTGMNIPALKFNGTTFNQNYYISITEGGAGASQAVVLNSTKDYSGIRDLSITRSFIASTSIASPSITCNTITGDNGAGLSILNMNYTTLNLNSTTLTATATQLNYNDITTLGAFQASKTMTLNSNGVGSFGLGTATTNGLKFYGGTANKEIVNVFRASDDGGLVIATKAQTIQKCSPLLQLYSGYDATGVIGTSSAEYKEIIRANNKLVGFTDNYQSGWFNGYLGGTPPWKSSGFLYATQFYTSMEALNICCNSSTTSAITSGNNILLTNAGQVCINTTTPSGSYQLTLNGTSSNNGAYISGNATVLRMDNTTGSTSDRLSYVMSHNTTWEMSLGGSAHAVVPNGLYWYNGGYKMVLTSSGRLGLGVTSPSTTIHVSGAVSQTTIPIGTNTYDYQVDTNAWHNNGGGPFSYSVCAIFANDIFVNNQIYCTSDRRLKNSIKPIDINLERYMDLIPSTYIYNNEEKIKIGLIAQDVRRVASEAVIMTENKNMKVEEENDIEGIQFSISYEAITTLNVAVIKKLIERIEVLEAKLLEKNI